MNQRPVIGITTTNLKALDGMPTALPDSWAMSQGFVTAPTRAGGLPWLVPLLDDERALRGIYERLDAVLIPGGADIDPACYGADRLDTCNTSDPPRDRIEMLLLGWCLADGKPLLGLCRGIQLINLARGGTLYQDLTSELPGAEKHDYFPDQGFARDELVHDVLVQRGSRLGRFFGSGPVRVNSMHHQAVRDLGEGLLVSARSAGDGVIEAIEVAGHPFLIGIQWHPEALAHRDEAAHGLFRAFIEAAGRFRDDVLGAVG